MSRTDDLVINCPAAAAYLPSASLDEYLRLMAVAFPQMYALLDFARPRTADALKSLVSTTNEFDSDLTGRGDSYRRAQRDASVRWTGARQLLRLATPDDSADEVTVLDVLGGDGTIARAVLAQDDPVVSKLAVLTGDVSGRMIEHALTNGLPAVRQAADFLFLREASISAVVLAYGTHHIDVEDRPSAVAEAVRVVRPGGRVVVHDFDESSPTARFFRDLVDSRSVAGHDYSHFLREQLLDLFRPLPASVLVLDVYDPLVVRAGSAQEACRNMCAYVGQMYGIHDVFREQPDTAAAWRLLEELFDHSAYLARSANSLDVTRRPVVFKSNGHYVAELPRVAIVAVAEKTG